MEGKGLCNVVCCKYKFSYIVLYKLAHYRICVIKSQPILCFSKTCVKWPLSKRPKSDFQDQLLLNVGQKYCRMLQGEDSAILSTFIKLQFPIKIFVSSIYEWLFYTGFTVYYKSVEYCKIKVCK